MYHAASKLSSAKLSSSCSYPHYPRPLFRFFYFLPGLNENRRSSEYIRGRSENQPHPDKTAAGRQHGRCSLVSCGGVFLSFSAHAATVPVLGLEKS